MNKRELIREIVNVLKENEFRKYTKAFNTGLHISDDDGNVRHFTVKRKAGKSYLDSRDVSAVMQAMLKIIESEIQKGNKVDLHGFGRFCLSYRRPTIVKRPDTGEEMQTEGLYVPMFKCGNELKVAAKIFTHDSKEEGENK